MRISSPAFEHNALFPPKFTCDGAGTNPALQISGVPPAAKSLALIVFDPDVPRSIKTDGRYLHWALWNLAPDTAAIAEGRGGGLSEGGGSGYVPACPPSGEHRYVFRLFALDRSLGTERIASEAALQRAMEGHVIEQAELVGRYTRGGSWLNFILLGAFALALVVIVSRFVAARRA
jgi:Raf kinase inhibitor-like YbhB/YbcL family protein